MNETTMLKTEEETEMILDSEEETEIKKPYTFKKLSSDDIFLMCSIASKIGINEFKKCFGTEGVLEVIKGMSAEDKKSDSGTMLAAGAVALEAVNIILGNIGKCKNEIYALLAQTSNLSVEEIRAEGNAVMFVEMIVDFLKKDEFPDFLKVVSKLSR